jgi:hypothetical protein
MRHEKGTSAGTTIDDLLDEMLAFGVLLEAAELVAPLLLPLENDPRGFRQALLEECPLIAERCGAIRRH